MAFRFFVRVSILHQYLHLGNFIMLSCFADWLLGCLYKCSNRTSKVTQSWLPYVQIGFMMVLWSITLFLWVSLEFGPRNQYSFLIFISSCFRLARMCSFQVSLLSKYIPIYLLFSVWDIILWSVDVNTRAISSSQRKGYMRRFIWIYSDSPFPIPALHTVQLTLYHMWRHCRVLIRCNQCNQCRIVSIQCQQNISSLWMTPKALPWATPALISFTSEYISRATPRAARAFFIL